jgi:hypothetical protein
MTYICAALICDRKLTVFFVTMLLVSTLDAVAAPVGSKG